MSGKEYVILWDEKFWNWSLKDLKLRDVQKERQLDRQEGRFREKPDWEA